MTPRSPGTKPEKMTNSEDPVRKCRILRDKELHPISRETDDKGPHAEGGRGLGRNGPRPVGPAHFRAQSAPFDLGASRAIYSPLTESHASIHSSSAAEEQRREGHRSEEEMVEWLTRVPLADVGTLHGRPRLSSRS
jgi:hypothetical protein